MNDAYERMITTLAEMDRQEKAAAERRRTDYLASRNYCAACGGSGHKTPREFCKPCNGQGYFPKPEPWSNEGDRGKHVTFACGCKFRQPRCEVGGCGVFASFSVYLPWQPCKFKFFCQYHVDLFNDSLTKRIPGLDRQLGNMDPEWIGSIAEMVKRARWGMKDEKQETSVPPSHTPRRRSPPPQWLIDYVRKIGPK